jgi:hypothetical protein
MSLTQTIYPENCLRGIPNPQQVKENELVDVDVFMFNNQNIIENSSHQISINWQDDDNAISFTLAQKRTDEELQFKGGVAVIPRSDLDQLSKLPIMKESFSYNRQRLQENEYHGNLILKLGFSPARRKMIANTLAAHVSKIIPNLG